MDKTEIESIAYKLYDPFSDKHWEIVKAEKIENGWNLTIQKVEIKNKGAANESNK